MLSDEDEFCNIIGAFKDDKLVACVTASIKASWKFAQSYDREFIFT